MLGEPGTLTIERGCAYWRDEGQWYVASMQDLRALAAEAEEMLAFAYLDDEERDEVVEVLVDIQTALLDIELTLLAVTPRHRLMRGRKEG